MNARGEHFGRADLIARAGVQIGPAWMIAWRRRAADPGA